MKKRYKDFNRTLLLIFILGGFMCGMAYIIINQLKHV